MPALWDWIIQSEQNNGNSDIASCVGYGYHLLGQEMETLNSQIESQLIEAGASLVGFADISGLPAAVRGEMTSAISMAVALDVSIVNEISEGPTQRYYHEYSRVNESLDVPV